MADFIRWFEDIGIDDVPDVGGKNASLGEMYRELTPEGIRVPDGFAVTATAYRHFSSRRGWIERFPNYSPIWTSRTSPQRRGAKGRTTID
jgi:phosphoenolpyruvate synthase/pyruvate phosphate dikinase